MSKTKNNTQDQKMKTCMMVVVSPLLIILGICLLVLILYCEGTYRFLGLSLIPFYLTPLYVYGHLISGLMIIVGIVVGILVIKKGRDKRGTLEAGRFAISGVVIGAVFFVFWISQFPRSTFTARKRCASNLQALGKWMILYASDYDEEHPQTEKWCDLLIEYMKTTVDIRVIEKCFICPANKKGRCHYAMNPNCELNLPGDIVLLFETKEGWNQFGGRDILTTENHKGEGCNVLFNDVHVEFVKAERLGELKWGIEKKDSESID